MATTVAIPQPALDTSEPTSPTKPDSPDEQRGRRRSRDEGDGLGDDVDGDDDEDGPSSRKRRRSKKGMDGKKFDCPTDGCGKSYSRAEHLYRHQLNHNPKQIYKCDHPGCTREFVRQDLCTRHKERHTARGSQLPRKDGLPTISPPLAPYPSDARHYMGYPPTSISPSLARQNAMAMNPSIQGTILSGLYSSTGNGNGGYRPITQGPSSGVQNGYMLPGQQTNVPYRGAQRPTSYGSIDTAVVTGSPRIEPPYTPSHGATGMQNLSLNSPRNDSTNFGGYAAGSTPYMSGVGSGYVPSNEQMIQSGMAAGGQAPGQINFNSSLQSGNNAGYNTSPAMYSQMDNSGYMMNHMNFGEYTDMGRSPFVQPHTIVDWLLDGASNSQRGSMIFDGVQDSMAMGNWNMEMPMDWSSQPPDASHAMQIGHLLHDPQNESMISEERRLKLLQYMKDRFNEDDERSIAGIRHQLLSHSVDSPEHILDTETMRKYVQAYWTNFHFQIPILHKPTFEPNTETDILLLTVIAIGACCLDKSNGDAACDRGADIADFIAWHIRWEIFQSKSSRPPAELWMLQSLILLEVYEKMFSTRVLHERAHIHHAATITTLRRSSALQGKRDSTSHPTGGPQRAQNHRERWLSWVELESMKRVVYACFLIDSLHAFMFGHNGMMVVHEMRLHMPCDDKCWNARNAQELSYWENRNRADGKKNVYFLDCLKSTINNRSTRTSAFGRSILMAGMISVCWHLYQRDLLENATGSIPGASGANSSDTEKWQTALTRAFDSWRRQFDEAIQINAEAKLSTVAGLSQAEEYPIDENLFEIRTVMHHLAHIGHNADIVSVQILTGAQRLLGRHISPKDQKNTTEKMRRWSQTSRARDATLYAVKLLKQVLLPTAPDTWYTAQSPNAFNGRANLVDGSAMPMPSASSATSMDGTQYVRDMAHYQGEKDFLLNRPWVLYFAALVLWAYAFMNEGPLKAHEIPTAAQLDIDGDTQWHNEDLRRYMAAVGNCEKADDLMSVRGMNKMIGLLRVMQRMCRDGSRWELLHEGAKRLDDCVRKLVGLEAHGRDRSSSPETVAEDLR